MESLIFTLTLVSFIIPIVNTTVNPHSFQQHASNSAKERGWNNFVIVITRSCPYLTLYSQFWTLIAMYHKTPTTIHNAQTISWFVFCVYHGINYIDTKHLAYHPQEFVKEVVGWKPPKGPLFFVWFGLHWQHTIFPFYLHYLSYKYNVDYNGGAYLVLFNFTVMFVYFVWHLFCWHVQGIAAYPFLNRLREKSREKSFYCAGIMIILFINCIVASMWKELFFYSFGFLNMFVFMVLY